MTCALFFCLETLRGHHGIALSHINGGGKIISEIQSNSSRASNVFSSLKDARNSLSHIRTICVRSLCEDCFFPNASGASPDILQFKLDIVQSCAKIRLRQWDRAFEALQDTNPVTMDDSAMLVLKMHRTLMGINCSVGQARAYVDDCVFDAYAQNFAAIVEYAEKIVQLYKTHATASTFRSHTAFVLDTQIIIPLYFTAVKCRDRHIRWKAIELLKASKRQEGMWSSMLAAKIAERVVSIEEEGFEVVPERAEDMPRSNRGVGVKVTFHTEHKGALLRYQRVYNDDAKTPQSWEEWIDW